jgi:alpha-tubulin suppressor-like RCC1 family protein
MRTSQMFSLISKFRGVRLCSQAVKPKGYTLYSWGSKTNTLGYKAQTMSGMVSAPTAVKGFDGKVTKAIFGQNHSAFITADGELYTFGSGKFGALGLDDKDKNHYLPQKVQYFEDKGLKVTDVALGLWHTIALTDDGQVYSFGQGRRKMWFGLDFLFPRNFFHSQKEFEGLNMTHISSGNSFATALCDTQDLYVWGRGEYGTLGNGRNKQYKSPVKNELITEFREKMGIALTDVNSIFRLTSGIGSKKILAHA